jgi:hypothetical protein
VALLVPGTRRGEIVDPPGSIGESVAGSSFNARMDHGTTRARLDIPLMIRWMSPASIHHGGRAQFTRRLVCTLGESGKGQWYRRGSDSGKGEV